MIETLRVVIEMAPRTKKTHNQVALIRSHGKGQPCPHCRRPVLVKVFPSQAWRDWTRDTTVTLNEGELLGSPTGKTFILRHGNRGVIWQPHAHAVNCRAVFYRDANRGDLIGYAQGLADLLEERGVLVNDALIQGWDGSRLDVDHERPRVEAELTPLPVRSVHSTGVAAGVS